jgi:hypothetical protein
MERLRCFSAERIKPLSPMLVLAVLSRLLELRLRLSDVLDTPVCLDVAGFFLPNITCFPDLELETVSAEVMVTLPDVPAERSLCVLSDAPRV